MEYNPNRNTIQNKNTTALQVHVGSGKISGNLCFGPGRCGSNVLNSALEIDR